MSRQKHDTPIVSLFGKRRWNKSANLSLCNRIIRACSMNLITLIQGDIRAKAHWLYGNDSLKSIIKARFTDGTSAMIIYRWMQWAQRRHLTPLAMLFNKLNVMGGCIVGRGADFGPGFVLVHSQGVVINTSVRGGRNVIVEHQVTIGAEKGASPIIGDNVFIGAGAKVLGGVTIGSGAKVGANAVVVDDVPAGATVVGVPARVVKTGNCEKCNNES
jgi:serine O-acetyltransferase